MKYRYTGPTSGVSLKDGDTVREEILHTDIDVDLPEGNEYVATLLALGHLTAIAAPSVAKRNDPKGA